MRPYERLSSRSPTDALAGLAAQAGVLIALREDPLALFVRDPFTALREPPQVDALLGPALDRTVALETTADAGRRRGSGRAAARARAGSVADKELSDPRHPPGRGPGSQPSGQPGVERPPALRAVADRAAAGGGPSAGRTPGAPGAPGAPSAPSAPSAPGASAAGPTTAAGLGSDLAPRPEHGSGELARLLALVGDDTTARRSIAPGDVGATEVDPADVEPADVEPAGVEPADGGPAAFTPRERQPTQPLAFSDPAGPGSRAPGWAGQSEQTLGPGGPRHPRGTIARPSRPSVAGRASDRAYGPDRDDGRTSPPGDTESVLRPVAPLTPAATLSALESALRDEARRHGIVVEDG